MNLIGCSFILGGKSIRKSNFSIGVFLSGSSGSIQKSTSGSIRIYPQKSGISGLLHHSNTESAHTHKSGKIYTQYAHFRELRINAYAFYT